MALKGGGRKRKSKKSLTMRQWRWSYLLLFFVHGQGYIFLENSSLEKSSSYYYISSKAFFQFCKIFETK